MFRKSNCLCFDRKILVLLIAFYIQNVTSFWEYAVSTKEKIILFDHKWTELEPTIRKDGLEYIKAITYDPVNDIFYFTDRQHPKTSIFSLKVREDTTFLTTPLVPRSPNEVIEDIIYDPHTDTLYWTDSGNKKIVKLTFDRSKSLKYQKETFLNFTGDVSGLELDSCQRNLYYTIVTESNPSINVVSLDKNGSKPVSFGNENHYKPVAIAMDHDERRIYIADVRKYNSYSIDSLTASGADFRVEIENNYRIPRSIAVDKEFVYYVEGNEHELRKFKKNSGKNVTSEVFVKIPYDPTDIIVRSNFVLDLDQKACKVSSIKIDREPKEEALNKMCLHGGILDKTTSSCMCLERFDGDYCEINLCYNFCLNGGDCSMAKNERTSRLEPKCSCRSGFNGEHCEVDLCDNFCLNGGKCTVGFNKKPKCTCSDKTSGSRCENMKAETMPIQVTPTLHDKNEQEATQKTTEAPSKVPDEYQHGTEDGSFNPPALHGSNLIKNEEQEDFSNSLHCPQNQVNVTYIILGICITLSLFIFLGILLVIRKINRPLRPRIRKKFVVHKNVEPLTYRPTTEQCEVIIEDCCNMNICETPCFDPKVLQQEINDGNISVKLTSTKKCSSKDDKQDLLKNMEYNQ